MTEGRGDLDIQQKNSNSINFRLKEIYAARIGGYFRNKGNDSMLLLIVRKLTYFISFEAIVATCFP
jgi:hypothetical protein